MTGRLIPYRLRAMAATIVVSAMGAAMPALAQDSSSWTSGTMVPRAQRPGAAKLLKSDPGKTVPKAVPPPADGAGALRPTIGVGPKFTPPATQSSGSDLPVIPPDKGGAGAASGATGPGTLGGSSTISKSTTGDDAAYEAFDQGRYLTALEVARVAAEKGEPSAHMLIGRIYQEGLGVAIDPVLAAQWFRRGAELGDVESMFAFGLMLAEGEGIQKNRAGAAQMFDEAARRGHILANYNLALLFLTGDGKPLNPYRAAGHLQYAAEAGIAVAQYDLATLYATGTGVEASAFTASEWLRRAAEAGHTEAEVEYGIWLFQGRGVPVSQSAGAMYFKSAAMKGSPVAQNRLARCFANGAGLQADVGQAATWHLIAKVGGVTDKTLDEIVAKLPKADRAKAQAAADEWIEKLKAN